MSYEIGDVAAVTFFTTDASGALADPSPNPTAVVTLPDLTTTAGTVAKLATGTWQVTFTTTLLGSHTVKATWTGGTARPGAWSGRVDVYGATIIDPYELRLRFGNTGIADTTAYPEDRAREAIRRAVEQWNRLAEVAIAPFASQITRIGDGGLVMRLPDVEVTSIVSLTINGVSIASTSYTIDQRTGVLRLLAGAFVWSKPVIVYYQHGLATPPGAAVDAIAQRAYELLVPPAAGQGRAGATLRRRSQPP